MGDKVYLIEYHGDTVAIASTAALAKKLADTIWTAEYPGIEPNHNNQVDTSYWKPDARPGDYSIISIREREIDNNWDMLNAIERARSRAAERKD